MRYHAIATPHAKLKLRKILGTCQFIKHLINKRNIKLVILSLLQSTHNLHVLSFFLTNKT
jgi:hypothetical protein